MWCCRRRRLLRGFVLLLGSWCPSRLPLLMGGRFCGCGLLRIQGCCWRLSWLGGLGLVLHGIFRVRSEHTPMAAAGLSIIMAGATVTTIAGGAGEVSLFPAVVGLLLVLVVRGRAAQLPI